MGARHRRRRDGGFTLIEMMIAVGIIGVLASAAIPEFMRYMSKARNVEGLHNVQKIAEAARTYFDRYRMLPSELCDVHLCTAQVETPSLDPETVCLQHGGVYPAATLVEFKQNVVWQQMLFSPEGNTRFQYWYHMAMIRPFPQVMATELEAWRYDSCGSTRRWISFFINFSYQDGTLRKLGPRKYDHTY